MCTWIEVERLDGSGGLATNAGELAKLLGCEPKDLIPENGHGGYCYGYECLCSLNETATARRFGYRVEFNPVGEIELDVLMTQKLKGAV